MGGQKRKDIRQGAQVSIVRKSVQGSGKRTMGTVKEILTHSPTHILTASRCGSWMDKRGGSKR